MSLRKRRRLTPELVRELSAKELALGITWGEYSVMKNVRNLPMRVRAAAVRWLMSLVGWGFFLFHPKARHDVTLARAQMARLLRRWFPAETEGEIPREGALVVGFHHPSQGEIPRLLLEIFEARPDEEILLPVALNWFEAMVPAMKYLRRFRLRVMPLVTERFLTQLDAEKLRPETLTMLKNVQLKLMREYYSAVGVALSEHCVVMVAPTAQRQTTIFKTRAEYHGQAPLAPVMKAIWRSIRKAGVADAQILPVAVLTFADGTALNFGRRYRLSFLKPFASEQIEQILASKTRKMLHPAVANCLFDYEFRLRIAAGLPLSLRYPKE